MPSSKHCWWVVLIALLLIVINLIPTSVSQETKPGIEIIAASAALVQVEGLLRNFSHFNLSNGPGEWLVRAGSVGFLNRDYRFLRRFALNRGGRQSALLRMKAETRGYFVPVMVIGLFFAFYQCSRNKAGIDGLQCAAALDDEKYCS